MNAVTLWLVLVALTPDWGDREPPWDRVVRLWVVAGAIDDAAAETDYEGPGSELRGALLATGYYESRYSRRIQEGRCRRTECDKGRAVGPWQAWPLWFDVDPSRGVGTDAESTFVAARAAAQALAEGRRRCGTLRGALSHYATGNTCEWKGAPKRHALAAWVALFLRN